MELRLVILVVIFAACSPPPRPSSPKTAPAVDVPHSPHVGDQNHRAGTSATDPPAMPLPVECGKGRATPELVNAAIALSQETRACYRGELFDGEQSKVPPEGRLLMRLEVMHDGTIRSADPIEDTVNAPAMTACVKEMFLSSQLPPTAEGCVTVNAPIVFKIKDPPQP